MEIKDKIKDRIKFLKYYFFIETPRDIKNAFKPSLWIIFLLIIILLYLIKIIHANWTVVLIGVLIVIYSLERIYKRGPHIAYERDTSNPIVKKYWENWRKKRLEEKKQKSKIV